MDSHVAGWSYGFFVCTDLGKIVPSSAARKRAESEGTFGEVRLQFASGCRSVGLEDQAGADAADLKRPNVGSRHVRMSSWR
jgi:hypothetical protein